MPHLQGEEGAVVAVQVVVELVLYIADVNIVVSAANPGAEMIAILDDDGREKAGDQTVIYPAGMSLKGRLSGIVTSFQTGGRRGRRSLQGQRWYRDRAVPGIGDMSSSLHHRSCL